MDIASYGSPASPVSNGGELSLEERQKQAEHDRQKKESMRLGQRQDRLWISWTSRKFNHLIEYYGGIGEVRAMLKAQIQRADALKVETHSSNKENNTALFSPPSSPSALTAEAIPAPPIQPSFEMYSPESDEVEMADKSDLEDEEDEDEEAEEEEEEDDDMVPEPEVNPNFELPPAPVLSPLKANPSCPSQLVVFGTPPFLERRLAWGGDRLLTLGMKSSADLQQVRPLGRTYSMMASPSSSALSYTDMHHHSSAFTESSAHSPYASAPGSPYQAGDSTTSGLSLSLSLSSSTDSSSDFASHDMGVSNNSFDDPSIMQAIIASMSPSTAGNVTVSVGVSCISEAGSSDLGGGAEIGGMDFNFSAINWTDGLGSLPEVTNQGWQPPLLSSSMSGGGLESSESSSFPRSSHSHTLSSSSSTLHSALG
jgi:hypothetical protein